MDKYNALSKFSESNIYPGDWTDSTVVPYNFANQTAALKVLLGGAIVAGNHSVTAQPSSSPTVAQNTSGVSQIGAIIGGAVSGGVVLVAAVGLFILWRRYRPKRIHGYGVHRGTLSALNDSRMPVNAIDPFDSVGHMHAPQTSSKRRSWMRSHSPDTSVPIPVPSNPVFTSQTSSSAPQFSRTRHDHRNSAAEEEPPPQYTRAPTREA